MTNKILSRSRNQIILNYVSINFPNNYIIGYFDEKFKAVPPQIFYSFLLTYYTTKKLSCDRCCYME